VVEPEGPFNSPDEERWYDMLTMIRQEASTGLPSPILSNYVTALFKAGQANTYATDLASVSYTSYDVQQVVGVVSRGMFLRAGNNLALHNAWFSAGIIVGNNTPATTFRLAGGRAFEMYLCRPSVSDAAGRGHNCQVRDMEIGDLLFVGQRVDQPLSTYSFTNCIVGYFRNSNLGNFTVHLNGCVLTGTASVLGNKLAQAYDILPPVEDAYALPGKTYLNNCTIYVPQGQSVVTGYANTPAALQAVKAVVWNNVTVYLPDGTSFVLGATTTGNVAPMPTGKMLIISGQSNALGKNDASALSASPLRDITPALTRQFYRVQIWNPTTQAFEKLTESVNGQTYPSSVGVELGIAQRWEEENPTETLYLVKQTFDGAHISRWVKGAGDAYELLAGQYINPAKAALRAAGLEPNPIAFFWSQGEAESGQNTYLAALTSFMGNLVNDALIKPNTLQLISENHYDQNVVGGQQRQYCTVTPQARYISTAAYGMMNDNLHYTAKTQFLAGYCDVWNAIFGSVKPYPFSF